MANAFLFPGQGSQFVGMGLELYRDRGTVRDIFDRANDLLGYRLSEIMFEGPEDELRATQNAQPAIFVHSYALYQLLQNPSPGMAAGHSLGEYTALTVAGVLTFDDALHLVRERAEAMAEAGGIRDGTMGAIVGLENEVVKRVCSDRSSESSVVVPANFNSDGQVVVSGDPAAVADALAAAKEAGARMVAELNVSGAFHSPLMKPAAERLAKALEDAQMDDAEFPVYMNVTAEPATDAGEIRARLLDQLTSPVHWTASVKAMIRDRATKCFEVGPGNVLGKLMRRIDRSVECLSIGDPAGVERFNANGSEE